MTKYIWHCGDWVPAEELYPSVAAPRLHIVRDLPAYKSPLGTGWVEGRRARREEMARHNVREVDPSEWKGGYRNPDFARKHGLPLSGEPLPKAQRMSEWVDR